ncbi:Hypp1933 [Branchiostoma lanceolatum]|uniref:Hypp1933 protein n=1 Tax=Branchiostoma lanceolatum TaxID=7740 RepID=A0A8K0EN01_BRALA|nr:Hypp1933 [Branchiostoma lanceolatum]
MASRDVATPVDDEDVNMSAAKDVLGASEVFSQLLASETDAWSREEGMGMVADPGTSGPWEQAAGVGGQLIQHAQTLKNIHNYFKNLESRRCCMSLAGRQTVFSHMRVVKQDGDGSLEEGAMSATKGGVRISHRHLSDKEFRLYKVALVCAQFPVLSAPDPPSTPHTPSPSSQRKFQFPHKPTLTPIPSSPLPNCDPQTQGAESQRSTRKGSTGQGSGGGSSDEDKLTSPVQPEALCELVRQAFGLSQERHLQYTRLIRDETNTKSTAKLLVEELVGQLSILENNSHPFYSPQAFLSRNAYDFWQQGERQNITRLIGKFWHFSLPPPLASTHKYLKDHHTDYKNLMAKLIKYEEACKEDLSSSGSDKPQSILSSTSKRLLKEFSLRYGVGELFSRIVYLEHLTNNLEQSWDTWYIQHVTESLSKIMEILPVHAGTMVTVKQELTVLENSVMLLHGQCGNAFTRIKRLFKENKPPHAVASLIDLLEVVLNVKELLTGRKMRGVKQWLVQYAKERLALSYERHKTLAQNELKLHTYGPGLSPKLLNILLINIRDEIHDYKENFQQVFSKYFDMVQLAATEYYSFFMEDVVTMCEQGLGSPDIEQDRLMLSLAYRLNQLDEDLTNYIHPSQQRWRRSFLKQALHWLEVMKEDLQTLVVQAVGADKYKPLTIMDKNIPAKVMMQHLRSKVGRSLTPSLNSAFNSVTSSITSSPKMHTPNSVSSTPKPPSQHSSEGTLSPNHDTDSHVTFQANEKLPAGMPRRSKSLPDAVRDDDDDENQSSLSFRTDPGRHVSLPVGSYQSASEKMSIASMIIEVSTVEQISDDSREANGDVPMQNAADVTTTSSVSTLVSTQIQPDLPQDSPNSTLVVEDPGNKIGASKSIRRDKQSSQKTSESEDYGMDRFQDLDSSDDSCSSDDEFRFIEDYQNGEKSATQPPPTITSGSNDNSDNQEVGLPPLEFVSLMEGFQGFSSSDMPIKRPAVAVPSKDSKDTKVDRTLGTEAVRDGANGQSRAPNTLDRTLPEGLQNGIDRDRTYSGSIEDSFASLSNFSTATDSDSREGKIKVFPLSASYVDTICMIRRAAEFVETLCKVLCPDESVLVTISEVETDAEEVIGHQEEVEDAHNLVTDIKYGLYQKLLQVFSTVLCLYGDNLLCLDLCATPDSVAKELLGSMMVQHLMGEKENFATWGCRHMLNGKSSCFQYISKQANYLCDSFEPVTEEMCVRINNIHALLDVLPKVDELLHKAVGSISCKDSRCQDAVNEDYVVVDLCTPGTPPTSPWTDSDRDGTGHSSSTPHPSPTRQVNNGQRSAGDGSPGQRAPERKSSGKRGNRSAYVPYRAVVVCHIRWHLHRVRNGLIRLLAYKINQFFHQALSLLLSLPLYGYTIQQRLQPLAEFLSNHFQAFSDWLYSECVPKLQKSIWELIVKDFEQEAAKLKHQNNSAAKAKTLLQAVAFLVQFVHAEGQGLDLENLMAPAEGVLRELEWYTVPTRQLISQYKRLAAEDLVPSRRLSTQSVSLPSLEVMYWMRHEMHSVRKCFSGKQMVDWVLRHSHLLRQDQRPSSWYNRSTLEEEEEEEEEEMENTYDEEDLDDGDDSEELEQKAIQLCQAFLDSGVIRSVMEDNSRAGSNVLSESSSLAGPLPEIVVVSRPASGLALLTTGTTAHTGAGQPNLPEVDEGHLSESSQPEDKRVRTLSDNGRLRSVSDSDSSYHFPERLGSDPRSTPLQIPDDPDVFANTDTHLYRFTDIEVWRIKRNAEDRTTPTSTGQTDLKGRKVQPDFLLDILQTRKQKDDLAKRFLRDLAKGMQQHTVGCLDVFWQ